MSMSSLPVLAGGYLTNTNQSISFLRNPSQDAAIGIGSLYNNPAGTAFLAPGCLGRPPAGGLVWRCGPTTLPASAGGCGSWGWSRLS